MKAKTKKTLLIAGGAVGVLAIGTFLVTRSASAAESKPAPVATDSDIQKVADHALVKETDPAVLRQLATAMLVLPYSNPLRNKVGALQARAIELELKYAAVQSGDGATARVRDF